MNHEPKTKNLKLTIGWLYPDLMSTYGDRGNILALQKRSEWRGIEVEILPITPKTGNSELSTVNLLFGGGAQDREQDRVIRDLKERKGASITKLIDNNIPSLFVCGSYQLLGKFYEPSQGNRIYGLGIFDIETSHPGPNTDRLIGNIVAKVNWGDLSGHGSQFTVHSNIIVGFENHGGRTKLGPNVKPFATVVKGYGNNGEDGTEGAIFKNSIGCYLHGPFLPKNPQIADFLIQKALEVKYKSNVELIKLDDELENKANNAIVKKLGIEI